MLSFSMQRTYDELLIQDQRLTDPMSPFTILGDPYGHLQYYAYMIFLYQMKHCNVFFMFSVDQGANFPILLLSIKHFPFYIIVQDSSRTCVIQSVHLHSLLHTKNEDLHPGMHKIPSFSECRGFQVRCPSQWWRV